MEQAVFLIAGAAVLAGALGVVLSKNPVHSALSLVGTLFGMAVLFLNLEAHFLAAVQVIVYAGAIVVLFLFVIMLLGVDRAEKLDIEPIVGQRSAAVLVGVAIFALPVMALWATEWKATGGVAPIKAISGAEPGFDIESIGEVLFTRYVFAFEITSVLLVIAVVGAVMLARRSGKADEIAIEGMEILEGVADEPEADVDADGADTADAEEAST